MAKCYTLMNEKARSDISVKLYYQLCGLDDLKKKKLETELEEMKKDLDSSKVKAKPTIKKPLPELSRKINPSNDVEKCTSNKCKLMNTQEAGKYFVANEEMSGKIYVIKSKYVTILQLFYLLVESWRNCASRASKMFKLVSQELRIAL